MSIQLLHQKLLIKRTRGTSTDTLCVVTLLQESVYTTDRKLETSF